MNVHSFFDAFSSYKKIPVLALFFLTTLTFTSQSHANSIGDFVWDDLNANGIQDIGEPGIPNIPVYLYDNASNFVEGTATDANGFYQITNIVAGTYFINLPIPLSFPYFVTTNNVGDDNFDSDITSGSQSEPFVYTGVAITNIDAGYVKYTPGIAVTKLASDPVKNAPDGTPLYITNDTWVTYTYIITNTGDANLSYVFLSDDVLFPSGLEPNPLLVECPSQFAPGQVITYTTQVLLNASVTNIASVQALPVNFKTCDLLDLPPVEDEDDAVVLLVRPGYDFEKTLISPTGRAARVGENIQFTISVINTGDVDLVVVPVVDTYDTNYIQYVSSVPPSVNNVNDGIINWTNIGPIAAFSTGTITTTFTAVRSTLSELLTNVAVTAPLTPTNVPGIPPQTNDAPYEISQPGYTVLKTVVSPAMPAEIGETIVFNLAVVNTGDVTLTTVPLLDTYDTNFLAYISATPASDNNTDDGAINWANVGPLTSGQTNNILVSFLAITNTVGQKTNTVVASPTVPLDEPPVPPQTSSVPYEILNNAFLVLDKDFISATEPDTNGNFEITYIISVQNSGESLGIYTLLDTPSPDGDVTISGGDVTGHTNLTLSGSGPYLLATNETILAGSSHVYTMRLDAVLSAQVLNGETTVSLCGEEDGFPQAGEGLFNEVLLSYDDNNIRITTNACGDVPPFLILEKTFISSTDPDNLGNFVASYQITVQNVGGTDGVYDLNDNPDPDPNVSILGGLVTGHSNVTLVGSGPYSIVVNEIIAASATHSYTVRLDAVFSGGVLSGSNTVSLCSDREDDAVAGEGLFNEAVLVYGSNDTTLTNKACGDTPPLLVLEKDFISSGDIDDLGNFEVTYVISVLNAGGSVGFYDLTDNPQPDSHVNILGGNVTGHTNQTLTGPGPYGIVTNESILAGATHVYTVRLDAVVSSDIMAGEEEIVDCGEGNGTPQAGEGLFNEAVVIYGDDDTTVTNDACGDLPPILVLEKDFLSTTDPDALGNFSVAYTITVLNNGGSSGTYDLTDTPAPDTEVTILGGDVTGHTNLTLSGPGPYTIVTNELIASGVSHVYTVRLDAVLSADVLDGSETVSDCGTQLPQPDSGLFNEAVVDYGNVSITNDACGEIPAFIVIEKDFVSATEADGLGNFQFEYVLTVFNSGGSEGSYDLIDDPSPDTNITINSGTVSGHIPQALAGSGPYNIAIGELIGAGVTHVYTVQLNAVFSGDILTGTTNVTTCGESTGTPQPEEALFNVAVVIFGEDDTTITNDACGDAPPFLVIDKEFVEATDVDEFGSFEIEYVVTVKNSGGSSTFYGLTDTPTPDANVIISGATISGYTNDALLGSGPYTLATSNTILVGETHTYTVRLDAVLTPDILFGSETVSQCGENTGTPEPGEGLYNEAEVTYGDDITVTTNACGDVPPVLVLNKFFVSASEADAAGNFVINYQIVVENSGGTDGSYDLQDVPAPDVNVTVTGGVVSGQANFALLGSGPWTLALNESISAGASHTFNVELYAVLGSNIINGTVDATQCGENTGIPQGGEGLYNEAILTYGTNDTTITNSVCGEIPPFITLEKEFIGATDADLDGNFVVTYAVTVHNSGGSQTNYNLVDTPSYDTNIVVTGATVIGQSSQTSGTFPPLPTFGRPSSAQGYNPACLIPAIPNANTNFPYFVIPIQTPVLEKFTVVTSGGVSDPYIFVYCSFDPSNPTNNILAGDDDGGPGFQSAFLLSDQVELTPLTSYDLVVSLFGSGSPGNSNVVLTFGGSIVFNEPATNFAGAGPYSLASDKPLPGGSTHTYTVMVYAAYSPQVLEGDSIPSDCGLSGGGAVPGEGLFNLATVQFGDNEVTFTNEACGDAPPFLTIDKEFLAVTGPDNFGNISATYAIEVFNSGGSATYYNLTDTPTPDVNLTYTNGSVTGHTNLALTGAGPYQLALNETIGVGVLHVYTVRLNGVLSSDFMLGVVTSTICSGGPGGGQPGEALYNFALLIYGDSNTTITDSDCGDIPEPERLDIGDTVWVDLNSNGNPDENLAVQGLNYVRVDLYNALNGVTNFVDFRITTTNGIQRGYYIFTNLANYGVYIAQVDISTVPPTVNVPTTPTRYFVPPTPGLNADFGFMPGNPTAVDLVEFRAEVFASQVQLIWETATELDNMGFNLYRATSPDGDRTRINDELVTGRGTGLGGTYQYDDPAVLDDGTYYYWLEDVEYNFSTREHGPLRVTVGAASTLAKVGTTSIQQDGVVMITAGTFERSGINLATIDPSRLRFYIGDQEIAAYSTASGSMMQSYDYILIYLDNESGDAMELSVGYSPEGEPLRIGMDFAFLSGDAGDVMTGQLPEGSGYMRLALSQAYVRCLLTGFTDPLIWLFDITNSTHPVLLLGADTVSVDGEVGLYFSYPVENSELIAISADSITEVDHFDP